MWAPAGLQALQIYCFGRNVTSRHDKYNAFSAPEPPDTTHMLLVAWRCSGCALTSKQNPGLQHGSSPGAPLALPRLGPGKPPEIRLPLPKRKPSESTRFMHATCTCWAPLPEAHTEPPPHRTRWHTQLRNACGMALLWLRPGKRSPIGRAPNHYK